MKITQDVREYAAAQGVGEEEALSRGMEEKSREFVEKGGEIYAKAGENMKGTFCWMQTSKWVADLTEVN